MTTVEDEQGDERAQLRRLEIVSFVEGATLVLLVCVALPIKHFTGHADAVHVMGPVHGLAFLAYGWIAIQTVAGGGWNKADVTRLFGSALVPFGGFFNLPFLLRKAAALR